MRSFLFVPATTPERFAKARTSGADAVIIDLEDAVSPEQKESARRQLDATLKTDRDFLVRINAPGSPWFDEDLNAIIAADPLGVVIPKAESTSQIEAITARLNPRVRIFPLIETAAGLAHCREIAKATQVTALMFGTLDFQLDLNLQLSSQALNPFRLELTLASRLAGIAAPIDGVCVDFRDDAKLNAELHNAVSVGFSGKLCIHPCQVAATNAAFLPSKDEIAWAERVIEADSASGGAATVCDGMMVDRPVVERAQGILRLAQSR